jgi:hypothetical protein
MSPPARSSSNRTTTLTSDERASSAPHERHLIADRVTSLADVFRCTPTALGFDVELKYPDADVRDPRGTVRSLVLVARFSLLPVVVIRRSV